MRFDNLRPRDTSRLRQPRKLRLTDTSGTTKQPSDALAAVRLVLLPAISPQMPRDHPVTTAEESREELRSQRDRAWAERDAALEEVVILGEQVASMRSYHTAMLDAVRAEERREQDSLIAELAILAEEVVYRALHLEELGRGAHVAHE